MTGSGANRRDVLTVAAISVVVFLISIVLHECAHAATALALGSKVSLITNVHVEHDAASLSSRGNQAVAASATFFNFAFALVFWGLWKALPNASPTTRYALWLTVAVNLFMPAGYLATSPLFGFGDWTSFLTNFGKHEPDGTWQIGLTVMGVVLYLSVIPLAVRGGLDAYLGKAEPERSTRKKVFSLVPWLAGSFAASLAGLLNPRGMPVAVMSLLATFGGMIGIAHLGWMWLKNPIQGSPEVPLPLERSVPWIVIAVVFFAVDFLVMGPGIVLSRR